MHFKLLGSVERFVTFIAFIRPIIIRLAKWDNKQKLLIPNIEVSPFMIHMVSFSRKFPATELAVIWLFTSMYSHMMTKACSLRETFTTPFKNTWIWLKLSLFYLKSINFISNDYVFD